MKPANYAPVYAGLYPELAEIARKHGYAMAVHGSLARDADLICIPWIDDAAEPQAVVDAITSEFVVRSVGEPSTREHGRIVYTLTVSAPGCFIDLSFTPRAPSPVSAPADAVEAQAVPVQDTWFTDRTLPVMAMSGDVESDHVIKLHFRRPVTDADRQEITTALNLHQASLDAARPAVGEEQTC